MSRGKHGINRAEYLSRIREFQPRGERARAAVLTAEKVRQIRADKGTHREVAARHGVHYRTIEKVRHYETWRHVL